MTPLIQKIFQYREQLVLVLMLEFLHFSIWADLSGPVSISLLLIHLGFFLIWQPLWQGDEMLRWYDILLLVVLTYTFLFWIDWGLILAWIILLMGLSGGRVIVNRRERTIYLLTLVFLVIEILIRCTPMFFMISVSQNITEIFEYTLPVLPLMILILPVEKEERRFHSVDFIHAISISTLTSLLVAGTLLNMYRTETEYLVALIETLIIIGIFLLAVSWLVIPRAKFSGLPQLWLKSMLNIGTPFESFLAEISDLFKLKSSPDDFLNSTMEELNALPWIEGVSWKLNESNREFSVGKNTKSMTQFDVDDLTISIHSFSPVSGALYLHCKLLVQLINNFYIAKIREREMTQQTHLQAVYETGARITHDIKNLLQSLQAITSIIINDSEHDNFAVSGKLLKKQLPALTQRLKMALEKLQAPETSDPDPVYLKDWWHDLKMRANIENVNFNADISGDQLIPSELFDSIIDNLIENIKNKSQVEEDLKTSVSLFSDESQILLSIMDSGKKIPDDIAAQILKEPLQSENGLGIGLFQATKQAESMGYIFILKTNLDGNVCFELSKQETAGQIELI